MKDKDFFEFFEDIIKGESSAKDVKKMNKETKKAVDAIDDILRRYGNKNKY